MRSVQAPSVEGNLWRRDEAGRQALFTRSLGRPASVYGERVVSRTGVSWRRWDPTRSKLAAGLLRDWKGPEPASGERWLYLGAATGTTASHLADLVGPNGAVFAIEKSLRPFVRLLAVAQAYPNLLPVLADARSPAEYFGDVRIVDGLYADLSQPDQSAIVRENARLFLEDRGKLIFAVKTASMGRELTARQHLESVRRELEPAFSIRSVVDLSPLHRRHYLVGGFANPAAPATRPPHREGRQVAVRPPR